METVALKGLLSRRTRKLPADQPKYASDPRYATTEEVDDWISWADQREYKMWEEIESLLNQLKETRPLRVRALRKELKWLRREARLAGFGWGINE